MSDLPEQEPQENLNATELHKDYSETAGRAKRFLISSAIILVILIVIVGQELREYRNKQTSLVKQIQTTSNNEQRAIAKLKRAHNCIRCELNKVWDSHEDCEPHYYPLEDSISAKVGIKIWDIPTGTGSVHTQQDIDALVVDEQRVTDLLKDVKARFNREDTTLQKANQQPETSSKAVHKADTPSSGPIDDYLQTSAIYAQAVKTRAGGEVV